MPFRMGPWEIGLILVVILIVFGVGKLPQAVSVRGYEPSSGQRAVKTRGKMKPLYLNRKSPRK